MSGCESELLNNLVRTVTIIRRGIDFGSDWTVS